MKIARLVALVLTAIAIVLTTRLELSKDLTALFPRTIEAATLVQVTRAFGGGDIALVLVRGSDPDRTEKAAGAVATVLRSSPVVAAVVTSPPAEELSLTNQADPTEAWRFAGPTARQRLAHALTEDGMRQRLQQTRSLLLGVGASDFSALFATDPLRLNEIPWRDQMEVAAGVHSNPSRSAFVTSEGTTRLVVLEPRGRAFETDDAARFTDGVEASLASVRADHPDVRIDLTGGHVVARQTEQMMRSDLQKSSVLSVALAALAFVLTFRRPRALLAVLPPLAAGTLWTTALAALAYPRLSAIATAFAAVVVGVGVDTGVHVYGRLLHARREGHDPRAAADLALRETWRPTLGAAVAAGGAFACLGFSEIEGMHQLGILCGVGEVLTAIAILVVVPEIGRLLERGPPPAPLRLGIVAALTATRQRAAVALGIVALVVAGSLATGLPKIDHAVVALGPQTLPALATYDAIYAAFGGGRGQVMIVSVDANEARARARSDAIAEALDQVEGTMGWDALARFAPSPELQRSRLLERDRLDLPGRAKLLERLLREEGFAVEAFAPALESFARPSARVDDPLASGDPNLAWLKRRHVARDGDRFLVVAHARLYPGLEEKVRTTLRGADPESIITGFADLERGLVRSLARDLPRVLAAALAIVVVVLWITIRRWSRIAIGALVLATELLVVLALSRLLGIRWHVYDALILPILLGITLDEVLFLLESAERVGIEQALAEQAPLGIATALTTAAGFGALVVCRFEGLADVGKVGALGSTVGLLLSLLVIPSVYRLTEVGPSRDRRRRGQ